MTKEGFTIVHVEMNLRRVFGEKSKKDIGMVGEKRPLTAVNVMRRQSAKKRKTEAPSGVVRCYYCLEAGYCKADRQTMKKDCDPGRSVISHGCLHGTWCQEASQVDWNKHGQEEPDSGTCNSAEGH